MTTQSQTQTQSPCRCEKTFCGRPETPAERCTCGARCECQAVCNCGSGCSCGNAK